MALRQYNIDLMISYYFAMFVGDYIIYNIHAIMHPHINSGKKITENRSFLAESGATPILKMSHEIKTCYKCNLLFHHV